MNPTALGSCLTSTDSELQFLLLQNGNNCFLTGLTEVLFFFFKGFAHSPELPGFEGLVSPLMRGWKSGSLDIVP